LQCNSSNMSDGGSPDGSPIESPTRAPPSRNLVARASTFVLPTDSLSPVPLNPNLFKTHTAGLRLGNDDESGSGGEDEDGDQSPAPSSNSRKSPRVHNEKFEALVSFGNLEGLLKGVLQKFGKLDRRIDEAGDRITTVNDSLVVFALKTDVEEAVASADKRVKAANAAIGEVARSIEGYQEQLDSLVKVVDTFDRRVRGLEKTLKGIGADWDDKLDRQRKGLEEKIVSCESRFVNYATHEEVAKVEAQLPQYATTIMVGQVSEQIVEVASKLSDFCPHQFVIDRVDAVRTWVQEEITVFAKRKPVDKALREIHDLLKDQETDVKDKLERITSDHHQLEITTGQRFDDMRKDVDRRAKQNEVNWMRNELSRFALAEDLADFGNKYVPKLQFCLGTLGTFHDRLNTADKALQRLDEALLDKASKFDIVVTASRIEHLMPKDRCLKEFAKVTDKMDWVMSRFEAFVASEPDRMASHAKTLEQDRLVSLWRAINAKCDLESVVSLYKIAAQHSQIDELLEQFGGLQSCVAYVCSILQDVAVAQSPDNTSKRDKTVQRRQLVDRTESFHSWLSGQSKKSPEDLENVRSVLLASRSNRAVPLLIPAPRPQQVRQGEKLESRRLEVQLGLIDAAVYQEEQEAADRLRASPAAKKTPRIVRSPSPEDVPGHHRRRHVIVDPPPEMAVQAKKPPKVAPK